jgi:hypothetical protein
MHTVGREDRVLSCSARISLETGADYYVVFWRQPHVPESDLREGVTRERVVWAASEHYVLDATERGLTRRRADGMQHTPCTPSS